MATAGFIGSRHWLINKIQNHTKLYDKLTYSFQGGGAVNRGASYFTAPPSETAFDIYMLLFETEREMHTNIYH